MRVTDRKFPRTGAKWKGGGTLSPEAGAEAGAERLGRAEQPVPGAALQPSPRARRGPQPALGGPRGSPTAAGKIGRGPAGEVARAPRLCLLAAPDAQDPVSGGIKKNRQGFNVNQGIGRLTNSPENKTHRKYIPEDVANHPLNSSSSSSHNFSS